MLPMVPVTAAPDGKMMVAEMPDVPLAAPAAYLVTFHAAHLMAFSAAHFAAFAMAPICKNRQCSSAQGCDSQQWDEVLFHGALLVSAPCVSTNLPNGTSFFSVKFRRGIAGINSE